MSVRWSNPYIGSQYIAGGTSQITGISGAPMQIQANGSATSALQIVGYSTTAADGPVIEIGRTKSAAASTNTIVASGDRLGAWLFLGANGASYTQAAEIRAVVDGTPGASNDMPGRIEIYTTADGSGTPVRRYYIDAAGRLQQDATNGSLLTFNRANTTINFAGTMGTSTKAPQTVANDGWIEVQVAGVAKYIPYYNAS